MACLSEQNYKEVTFENISIVRNRAGLSLLAIFYYIFEQINLLKSFVNSCDRCVLLKRKPRFE